MKNHFSEMKGDVGVLPLLGVYNNVLKEKSCISAMCSNEIPSWHFVQYLSASMMSTNFRHSISINIGIFMEAYPTQ